MIYRIATNITKTQRINELLYDLINGLSLLSSRQDFEFDVIAAIRFAENVILLITEAYDIL